LPLAWLIQILLLQEDLKYYFAVVVKQATEFIYVEVRASPENLDLYRTLTGLISEILAEYESIIVLEDDILTSPYFLQFMLDDIELF